MAEIIHSPSPNFNDRRGGKKPGLLVIHYTGMQSAEAALHRMRDPEARVSAHYMIEEDGSCHQLVAEEKRAWHAGVGSWRGETDLNSTSIGIELVNPGHEFGYRPFSEAQLTRLIPLCQQILQRWQIPATAVVGHSDLAPTRKQDPGELFPWQRLAEHGIGIWPDDAATVSTLGLSEALSRLGYGTETPEACLTAFCRHWHPEALSNGPTPETHRRLLRLLEQMGLAPL